MGDEHAHGAWLRWRFGKAELDEGEFSLTVSGVAAAIEPRPLELLMFILRRAEEVCTKQELMEALWPGRVVSEGSLTNCVAKLRLALGDAEQTVVRTVHGYGYRLGVPVRMESIEAPEPSSALKLVSGMAVPRRSGWALVEKLGEGGAGEVWLGQSKTGERRVFKFCQDAELLVTLKRELTLSRLLHEALGEHPEFVRVLDWNFDEPPYYLESEHCVEGSLAQWLTRQPALPPLAERLEWLAQAADALAAAHALGVLHKDLKPSNLLVEIVNGRVRLKLGDWGSGHVLDLDRLRAARVTRLGFSRTHAASDGAGGTRLYQAPEVAAGQPATIQADVYSMGVMLYQLGVGDLLKPLAPGWERDIDDELLREDIARAADGNPAQRLADAAELARRIRARDTRREQRAQDTAERLGRVELLRRAERRQAQRWWVLASGLLLVSGLIASLLLYRRAETNAVQAREQARTAEAAQKFLVDIFLANDRSVAQDRPVQDVSAKALLDASIEHIATGLADQPAVQLKLLKAAQKIYAQWNDQKRRQEVSSRIVALSEALYGRGDPRTLDEMMTATETETEGNNYGAANTVLDEVERRITENGLENTATHAHLLYYRNAQIDAVERQAEKKSLLERGLAILRGLHVRGDPIYPTMNNNLAGILFDLGDLEGGKAYGLEAVRAQSELPEDLRDDGLLGAMYGSLASQNLLLGDVDGAESAFSHAEELIDKTYGETNTDGWFAKAIHAQFIHRRGDRVRAMTMFTELTKHIEATSSRAEATAGIRQIYAECLIAEGRPAEAIPLLQAAIQVYRDVVGSGYRVTHQEVLLGSAYGASGHPAEARALLKAAHDKGPSGSADAYYWMLLRRMWAEQLIRDGEWTAAQVELEALRAEAQAGGEHRLLAQAQSLLARAALARNDTVAALELSNEALASISREKAFYDIRIAASLWRVHAQVLAQTGDADGASQWCVRARDASRRADYPGSSQAQLSCGDQQIEKFKSS